MHELTAPLYRICQEAGTALCELYAAHLLQPLAVTRKADASPVTRADYRANEIISAGLASLLPGVPVLSEETRLPDLEQRQGWAHYWLVDPLDGTREFLEATGQFAISVALLEGDSPVLGAIYLPLAGWMYVGGPGYPPLRYAPAQQCPLQPAMARADAPIKLLCSRRGDRDPRVEALAARLARHFPWVLRELRGSAWKFCRICEGGGHLYPRFGATSEWDTAAGQALLEAAGGRVVDFSGRPLRYNTSANLENPPFLACGPGQLDLLAFLPESS